jgi:FKBP-type peptidyl-prolyl cis-trans isomerase SlyD
MTEIAANTVASVHYTGTLPESGEVFDSSEGRDPLTFLVGHKQMIPGFEEEMMGAAVGERREFTLEPERAYGHRMEEAVQQIEKEQFGDIEPQVGMMLMSDIGPFTVTAVDDALVTVDFNHKLAGETLHFSVEVVEVRAATEEEVAHGHAHGPGGHHH